MHKLVLSLAIASLIAVPSAFAHGNTSGHARMHASVRHTMHHRGHRASQAADRTAALSQSSQSSSSVGRHPDEEELAVDELASQAK